MNKKLDILLRKRLAYTAHAIKAKKLLSSLIVQQML